MLSSLKQYERLRVALSSLVMAVIMFIDASEIVSEFARPLSVALYLDSKKIVQFMFTKISYLEFQTRQYLFFFNV